MAVTKWWYPYFKTQKHLIEEIRRIVKSTKENSEVTGEDCDKILWVLSHHRNHIGKIGTGVRRLIVINDGWGGSCFAYERNDGSIEAISWQKSIRPPTERSLFIQALRHEIDDQILHFKATHNSTTCGICGLNLGADLHADHIKPFRELVSEFFGGAIYKTYSSGTINWLVDRSVADDWKRFHKENATLQFSHAECNMEKERQRCLSSAPTSAQQ